MPCEKLNPMSLERNIVEHCAPTLAGMKCGCLFHHRSDNPITQQEIRCINLKLRNKGVSVTILRSAENGHLIYVYRKGMVEHCLSYAECLLKDLDYDHVRSGSAIKHLKSRISESARLPPEIGIFLGYPLDDIVGFIEHEGRNCKCAGCWKVYGDEEHAIKLFNRYRMCRMIYKRRYSIGTSMEKLTVRIGTE